MPRAILPLIVRFAERAERLRWSHAAVALTALFSVANFQLITNGAHEKWDAHGLAAPYFSLLAKLARTGRLLLWNPWVAGGSPDFAVAGSGTFSPDLVLFALAAGGSERAYIYFWLLVWLAGGLGMLLLGRHLRAPVWVAFCVACGYVFSGFYTGHAEHLSVLYSQSLLPFIIWRLDSALERRNFLASAQAGILLGLSGLAGYPALTLGTGAVTAAWWASRVFFCEAGFSGKGKATAILTATYAIGGLVLFPALLAAAYETPGYSDRSKPLPREYALKSNALAPGTLATLTSPAFAEVKIDQPKFWEYTDVSSVNLYTGSVTVFLACAAIAGTGKRRAKWALLAGGTVALLCAMSHTFPLRGWLYDFVPVTQYFRHSSMLRGYFLFALSVLALLAFPQLGFERQLWKSRGVLFVLPAACALLVFAALAYRVRADFEHLRFAAVHCAVAWMAPAIIATIALRRPKHVHLIPVAAVLIALVDALMNYSLSNCTISDIGPALRQPGLSAVQTFDRSLGASSHNTNLYDGTPTFKNYAPLKNLSYEYTAAYPQLGHIAVGADRIWFAADVPEVSVNPRTFDSFKAKVMATDTPLFVRHSRSAMTAPDAGTDLDLDRARLANAPQPQSVPASVRQYTRDKLTFDTIAPKDGWLMVTERWSRSWRATVNGVEQPVSGANFIFRALPVSTGSVHVEFNYHPPFIFTFVLISWSIVALIGLLSVPWAALSLPALGLFRDPSPFLQNESRS